VHSTIETEHNVEDSRSNRDFQQKQGVAKGNHERLIDHTKDTKHVKSNKRIQEDDNDDNVATTESNNTNEKTHLIAKIVNQKHPYNVSVPWPKARSLGGNHLLKQMKLSHDQIFNLVAHCLDDLEIPIFLNSYQCIKIKPSNPRVPVPSFLDCVPPFVHPEITHLFGMENM